LRRAADEAPPAQTLCRAQPDTVVAVLAAPARRSVCASRESAARCKEESNAPTLASRSRYRERSELRALPYRSAGGDYPSNVRAAAGEHTFGRGRPRAGRRPSTDGGGQPLRGIKENVIMGRLIPAGTGLPAYKKLQVVIDEKSPTYAPPTFARVQPADLVAVGDE
jgi:hypothetical protein